MFMHSIPVTHGSRNSNPPPCTPRLTPETRRARGWMMTWPSLACNLGSILFLLAFLAAVVFVDPAVYFGSEDLDFCGLTSVFFTLDMLPLVFLLFSNDAKVPKNTSPASRTLEHLQVLRTAWGGYKAVCLCTPTRG